MVDAVHSQQRASFSLAALHLIGLQYAKPAQSSAVDRMIAAPTTAHGSVSASLRPFAPVRAWNGRCARKGIMALAYPSSSSQQSEAAGRSRGDASSSAAAVIERPTRSCPYPRPDGWETDTTPFSSADLAFSPEALESTDAIDETELRERIAAVSAAEEAGNADTDDAADQPGGMSASLKGMLLLNLGAALFGSNMVRRAAYALDIHLETAAPQAVSMMPLLVGIRPRCCWTTVALQPRGRAANLRHLTSCDMLRRWPLKPQRIACRPRRCRRRASASQRWPSRHTCGGASSSRTSGAARRSWRCGSWVGCYCSVWGAWLILLWDTECCGADPALRKLAEAS